MIATEAGVGPIDVLESVGEPRGSQIMGSEPSAQKSERSHDRRESDADQCKVCQCSDRAECGCTAFPNLRPFDILNSHQIESALIILAADHANSMTLSIAQPSLGQFGAQLLQVQGGEPDHELAALMLLPRSSSPLRG